MKYLWLFFLVQGWWYYTYYQYFFTKILLLDRGQHEAMSQTKLLHQPAISQQTQNIFSSNNCQTSCCTCSDLFITCLHFCLAPWYLCTCKSFFWYMLACLSTSLKSHHVHVNCPCWSSWLKSSDQRRDGGGDPHTRQESTASSPQKENSLFSEYIFILNCYSGWKVCTWCVFDVFRDWNVCQRWLRSAKVKGSCKEKNGHHYLHINLYGSCIIHIYVYNMYMYIQYIVYCIYQLTDTTVDPSLVHFNLWGICKHFNQWTSASF